MTAAEDEPPDDWIDRLNAEIDQRERRRERLQQLRTQLAAARAAGLRARHARRLSRTERPGDER